MTGRRGFALVAALISLVLLGALIVGAFFAATEETRVSAAVRAGARALREAESGAESAIGGWAAVQSDSLNVGQRASRSFAANGVWVTTTLIRLDSTLFWVVGEAEAGEGTPPAGSATRRRIGVLTRRASDSSGRRCLLRLEERSWSELF